MGTGDTRENERRGMGRMAMAMAVAMGCRSFTPEAKRRGYGVCGVCVSRGEIVEGVSSGPEATPDVGGLHI